MAKNKSNNKATDSKPTENSAEEQRKALFAQAETAGIETTGEESLSELKRLIASAENGGDTKPDDESNSKSAAKPEGTACIVWLKTRAYVDETRRLDAGVYRMTPSGRLSRLPAGEMEVFENGKIPPVRLAAIAKWAGLTKADEKSEEEILNVVLSEPNYFE